LFRTAILFGVLLILVGVVGYAMGGDHKSPTALIPAVEGILLTVCGAVVVAKPEARKHAMHAAATVGLLGFLAAGGRLMSVLIQGKVPAPLAMTSLSLMLVLSAAFVVLCVASFVSARRKRAEETAGFPPVMK
jgi:hypothetical protein